MLKKVLLILFISIVFISSVQSVSAFTLDDLINYLYNFFFPFQQPVTTGGASASTVKCCCWSSSGQVLCTTGCQYDCSGSPCNIASECTATTTTLSSSCSQECTNRGYTNAICRTGNICYPGEQDIGQDGCGSSQKCCCTGASTTTTTTTTTTRQSTTTTTSSTTTTTTTQPSQKCCCYSSSGQVLCTTGCQYDCSGSPCNIASECTATTTTLSSSCSQECTNRGYTNAICRTGNICYPGEQDIGQDGCGSSQKCCCSSATTSTTTTQSTTTTTTVQTTTTTTTTQPITCSNHAQCSQACTSLCPNPEYYGCCYGCKLGQCISGKCQCVDSDYCKNPVKQVGNVCGAVTTTTTTSGKCGNGKLDSGEVCDKAKSGYCEGCQFRCHPYKTKEVCKNDCSGYCSGYADTGCTIQDSGVCDKECGSDDKCKGKRLGDSCDTDAICSACKCSVLGKSCAQICNNAPGSKCVMGNTCPDNLNHQPLGDNVCQSQGSGVCCCGSTTTTSSTTTTTQPITCSNHAQCSQACTSLCPNPEYYGCCYGCKLGQCISGKCQCVDSDYCKNPVKQVGNVCGSSTTTTTPNSHISTDKTTYNQGENVQFSGSGFAAGIKVLGCMSVDNSDNDENWLCDGSHVYTVSSQGTVSGVFLIGYNIPVGPQKFRVYDTSYQTHSNTIQVQITSTSCSGNNGNCKSSCSTDNEENLGKLDCSGATTCCRLALTCTKLSDTMYRCSSGTKTVTCEQVSSTKWRCYV